jgi:hypothetical protein
MELKSFEKPWLPAIKGIFLILFGITGMLQIIGSIRALSVVFIVLISAMAILLIGWGIIYKSSGTRIWSIVSGVINLFFSIYLLIKLESATKDIVWIILVWAIFYLVTELVEAGILIRQKNAFAVLFLQNALLSLLFIYFLNIVMSTFSAQGVFYIGLIALVFGITNIISSYLLKKS